LQGGIVVVDDVVLVDVDVDVVVDVEGGGTKLVVELLDVLVDVVVGMLNVAIPLSLQSESVALPPRLQSFTVVVVVVVGSGMSSYTTASISQLSFRPE
jgi:hypothetical protein